MAGRRTTQQRAWCTVRTLLAAGAAAVAIAHAPLAATATLRIGWPALMTTLDPARADDMWAQANAGLVFDQLYGYDYLARPVRIVPLAAESLPVVSADGFEIIVRIRAGIVFSPHRAFGDRPRELTAADFVYSVKRVADPALRSPSVSLIAGRIAGLDEWTRLAGLRASAAHYDAAVAGLVAIDARTLRIRLTRPDPAFVYMLASPLLSIVPREAVEADGEAFARRPTGSGPYVVHEFQPGSRLVLDRNPRYRPVRWGDLAAPQAGEPAWAAALRGRRFPLADRIELVEIAERTTGLLSLEQRRIDLWPASDGTGMDDDRLSARLATAGITLVRGSDNSARFLVFNMRDRDVGGASVRSTALRRAIAMSIDDVEYIRVMRNGNGKPGLHAVPEGIAGHDAGYRNPNGFDPHTANALLDRVGYRRGADGYRSHADGRPLAVTTIVETTSSGRRLSEFLKRSLDRIGVRVRFEAIPLGDRMARIAGCRFQLTVVDWLLDWPDASNLLFAFYGSTVGTTGISCLEDATFDAKYDRLATTPPGPVRDALYREMIERLDFLMPARVLPTGDMVLLAGPGVRGLLVHPAIVAPFAFVDVTPAER